jgi:hypothetical protein
MKSVEVSWLQINTGFSLEHIFEARHCDETMLQGVADRIRSELGISDATADSRLQE